MKNFRSKVANAQHTIDRILLILIGFVILLTATYAWPNSDQVKLTWLGLAALLIAIGIGFKSFSFAGMQLGVENKVQALQDDLRSELATLSIIVPIVARIAVSPEHQNLFPYGGRMYVYKMMHNIINSGSLTADKEKLVKELKWVLLQWIFYTLSMEPFIEMLQEDKRFEYNLEAKSDQENLLKNKIESIKKELSNALNSKTYDFHWLRNGIIGLRDANILDKLSESEKADYKRIISYYQNIIENFTDNSTIDHTFLKTGQRSY